MKQSKILGRPLSNSGIRASGRKKNTYRDTLRVRTSYGSNSVSGLRHMLSGSDQNPDFGQDRTTRDRFDLAQNSAGVGSVPKHGQSGITRGLSRLGLNDSQTRKGIERPWPNQSQNQLAARKAIKKAKVFKRAFKAAKNMNNTDLKQKKKIRCFRCKNYGHIASYCPSKYDFSNYFMPNDYLVKGTELGAWGQIWVVDRCFKKHMTGDETMFKNKKDWFSIETKTNDNGLSYTTGIGEVEVFINGKYRLIPSVRFVPNLDKNVLSYDQLIDQGFEVMFEGNHCLIKGMFETNNGPGDSQTITATIDPNMNYINPLSDKEDQNSNLLGYFEKQFDMDFNEICEKNKGSVSSESVFDETSIWVAFLDTLHIPNYVEQCKESLREEFATFVKWFYKKHFGQKNKEYPPKLPNGSPVELLDLYMYIESAGGYEKASKANKWPEIAVNLGFDKLYAANLMIIYQGYLDLMCWRYRIAKEGENKAGESSTSTAVKNEDEIKNTDVNPEDINETDNINTNDKSNMMVIEDSTPAKEPGEIEDSAQLEELKISAAGSEDEHFNDADLSLEDYEDLEDLLFMDEEPEGPTA